MDQAGQQPVPDKESKAAQRLRNPFVVGMAVLATVAAAFQVAGVTTMLLAKIILAAGIWLFVTIEVWCSKWIKKTGSYSYSIVLLASCISGLVALWLGMTIAHLRIPVKPILSVSPERVTYDTSLPNENYAFTIKNDSDIYTYGVHLKLKFPVESSLDEFLFKPSTNSLRPIIDGSKIADIAGVKCIDGSARPMVIFLFYRLEPHGIREIGLTHTVESNVVVDAKISYFTSIPLPRVDDMMQGTGTFHADELMTCKSGIGYWLDPNSPPRGFKFFASPGIKSKGLPLGAVGQ